MLNIQLPLTAVMDSDEAAALAAEVIAKDAVSGFQGSYRYLKQSDGNTVRIRFLDCGREIRSFQRYLLTSLLLSAMGLLVLLGMRQLTLLTFVGRVRICGR